MLRDFWRVSEVGAWLAHVSRRDCAIAPAAGLRVGPSLVRRLRALAQEQDGEGIAVMCGGASTDAKWTPSGPVLHVCHACREAVVPSFDHVFWRCSFFSPLRVLPRPSSLLALRLHPERRVAHGCPSSRGVRGGRSALTEVFLTSAFASARADGAKVVATPSLSGRDRVPPRQLSRQLWAPPEPFVVVGVGVDRGRRRPVA